VTTSCALISQRQSDAIEVERARSAVTLSLIAATRERCGLAGSADRPVALDYSHLMAQAAKGVCWHLNGSRSA